MVSEVREGGREYLDVAFELRTPYSLQKLWNMRREGRTGRHGPDRVMKVTL